MHQATLSRAVGAGRARDGRSLSRQQVAPPSGGGRLGEVSQTTAGIDGIGRPFSSFASVAEPGVNQFSAARTLHATQSRFIPQDELALWTILGLRLPLLAEALLDEPDAVDLFGGITPTSSMSPEIVASAASPTVREVMTFENSWPLKVTTIKQLATS